MSGGEQLEEKTKCMERVRKKQKEPLGNSMWASYAVLEKEHSPPSLACLVLHTQLAMFKHKCPALCSEEMPLDLTSSQIFSACPKILGKYSFFLDEYKTKYMPEWKGVWTVRLSNWQRHEKNAFFKIDTGIGTWGSTYNVSSSTPKEVLLCQCTIWPWPCQAQLVHTRYCSQSLSL